MSVAIQSEPRAPELVADQIPAEIHSDGSDDALVASLADAKDDAAQPGSTLAAESTNDLMLDESIAKPVHSVPEVLSQATAELAPGQTVLGPQSPIDTLSAEAGEASTKEVIDSIDLKTMSSDAEVASADALTNSESVPVTDGDMPRSESVGIKDATGAKLPDDLAATIPEAAVKDIDSDGREEALIQDLNVGNTNEEVAEVGQGPNIEPNAAVVVDDKAADETSPAVISEPPAAELAPSPSAEQTPTAIAEEEPPAANSPESNASPSVKEVRDTAPLVDVAPIEVQGETDEHPTEPTAIASEASSPSEAVISAPSPELPITQETNSMQTQPVEPALEEPKTVAEEVNEEPEIQATEQELKSTKSTVEQPGAIAEAVADAIPDVEVEVDTLQIHSELVEVPSQHEPITTAGDAESPAEDMGDKEERSTPDSEPVAQDQVEDNEGPTQPIEEISQEDAPVITESSLDAAPEEQLVENATETPAAVITESKPVPTVAAGAPEVTTAPEAEGATLETPILTDVEVSAEAAGTQPAEIILPAEDVPVVAEISPPVVTATEETSGGKAELISVSDEDLAPPVAEDDAAFPGGDDSDKSEVFVEATPAVHVKEEQEPSEELAASGVETVPSESAEKHIAGAELEQPDDSQQVMSCEDVPVANEYVGPQGELSMDVVKGQDTTPDTRGDTSHTAEDHQATIRGQISFEKIDNGVEHEAALEPELQPATHEVGTLVDDPQANAIVSDDSIEVPAAATESAVPEEVHSKDSPPQITTHNTPIQPPTDEERSIHRTLPVLLVNDSSVTNADSDAADSQQEPISPNVERPQSPWTPSFQVTTVGRSSASPTEEILQTTDDLTVPLPTPDTSEAASSHEPVEEPIAVPEASPIPELSVDTDVSGKSEEPARPWTPSYSVHSQGSSPHLANSELPEESGVSALEPPRSWTPSYSVHSQGSPLLASSDPPQDYIPPLDEAVPKPVSQTPPDLVVSPPAELDDTNQTHDITSESARLPPSYIPAEIAEINSSAPSAPAPVDDAQTEPGELKDIVVSSSAEVAAESHESLEATADVAESQQPANSADHGETTASESWEPAIITTPSRAIRSTSGEVHSKPTPDPVNGQGNVPEESAASALLGRSDSLTWVPSYSVNSQGSPLQPETNLPASEQPAPPDSAAGALLERSNYYVNSQGSPLQAPTNLPVFNEPAPVEPAGDATDESNSPTWVPSYSVKSQGSPLQPTTELQTLDEPVRAESAADQPPEGSNSPTWVPSYSVKSQGSPLPTEVPIPDESFRSESTASAPIESSNSPTWVPSYSVNGQGSPPQPEEPAPLESTGVPLEDSSPPTWVPSYSVNSQGSSPQPEESTPLESTASASLEDTNSPTWVPSYSVSNQGSPLLTGAKLRSLDEPTAEEPHLVAPIIAVAAPHVPSGVGAPAVAEVAVPPTSHSPITPGTPTIMVNDEAKMEEPEEIPDNRPAAPESYERPRSPWTPSYSVSRQGSVSSLRDKAEAQQPHGSATPTSNGITAMNTSQDLTYPLAPPESNGLAAEGHSLSDSMVSETSGTYEEAPEFSDHEIPPASTPTQKAFPKSESTAEQIMKPITPMIVTAAPDTQVAAETVPSLDAYSPSSRSRLESTTSSRFFPGGWFSTAAKVPDEGRTSLDIAQGEFIPSKPTSPTSAISDISTAEESEISEGSDTESAIERKSRWCVVM